jgi:hypothetical protein
MTDELFALLTELPENRTAFIAALIMERAKKIPECGGFLVPRFNAYQATRIAQNLVKLASRIHGFAELDCNRGLHDHEEKRYSAAQAKFAEIAAAIGFVATTGGDPRGACAYIADRANLTDGDDMGGRGWGVYS